MNTWPVLVIAMEHATNNKSREKNNAQIFCLEQEIYTAMGAWFQYLVIPQLFVPHADKF